MSKKGRWAVGFRLMAAGFLLVLAGCGQFFQANTSGSTGTGTGTGGTGGTGTGGSSTSPGYFYVANQNQLLQSVAGYSFDGAGLTGVTNSPYTLSVLPTVMAVTPDNKFLYVGSGAAQDGEAGVFVFTINTDGSLTIANGGAAVSTDAPSSMVIDPTGKWLVDMQNGGGDAPIVSSYAINDSTGALNPQPNAIGLEPDVVAEQLYMVPGTSLIYATLGTGGFDGISLNTTTGALVNLNLHVPVRASNGSSDVGLASDPNGQFLFVSEVALSGVRVFSINQATGGLSELSTSPTLTPLGPNALLVDATGSYLYVALRTEGQVAAYAIGPSGGLTELAGSPFTTGQAPVSLAEDATGSYLLVGCSGGSPDFQVFAIGSATATVPGGLTSVVQQATGGTVSPAGVSAVVATH